MILLNRKGYFGRCSPSPCLRSTRDLRFAAASCLSRSFCSRSSLAWWLRAAAPRIFFFGVWSTANLVASASSDEELDRRALSASGELDFVPVRWRLLGSLCLWVAISKARLNIFAILELQCVKNQRVLARKLVKTYSSLSLLLLFFPTPSGSVSFLLSSIALRKASASLYISLLFIVARLLVGSCVRLPLLSADLFGRSRAGS